MHKKQFFRLTVVLILPFLILSWWLSQQDFILERGQQITCDVESNYCRSVSSFPVQYFDVISENNGKISYADAYRENIIFFENFKYPIEAKYFDESKELYIVDIQITAETLEKYSCRISGFYGLNDFNYSCPIEYVPFYRNSGKFKFLNPNDYNEFQNLNTVAKKELNNVKTTRIWIATALFFAIFIGYLIISFLIKFILYGIKKSDK